MAILDILVYPDSRLRTRAEPVDRLDTSIVKLIDDMAETMYAAPGIGLAATQVNVHKRVVVIDISETKDQLQAFVNPVLVGSGDQIETDEGCLSVPGAIVPVWRFSEVQVSALDQSGQPFEIHASGLLSICIQHEVDHLDGKVFVDYLSQLKRDRIRKRLVREFTSSEHSIQRKSENSIAS